MNVKDSDPRPKRRRDKENPYQIYTVGIHTDAPKYYIAFTDSMGHHCEMEIKKEVFTLLNRFELEDLSFLHEVENHYEHSKRLEAISWADAVDAPDTVEEVVLRRIQTEALHQAILKLPEIQRRRLLLYYFGDFTYEKIAQMEGCSHQSVWESIHAALKNLKNFFNRP